MVALDRETERLNRDLAKTKRLGIASLGLGFVPMFFSFQTTSHSTVESTVDGVTQTVSTAHSMDFFSLIFGVLAIGVGVLTLILARRIEDNKDISAERGKSLVYAVGGVVLGCVDLVSGFGWM